MRIMLAVLSAAALSCAGQAFGQNAAPQAAPAAGYILKPPVLAVPAGAPGAVRRTVMQFYNWTLLCDEMLSEKKRVCNVTQTVHDAQDNTVFSWSLAASDDGKPFLLLRALPQADVKMPLSLKVKSSGKTANVPFIGCNAALCMGQTPVGPILTQAIKDEAEIELSYKLQDGSPINLQLPLRGLRAAVAAIN